MNKKKKEKSKLIKVLNTICVCAVIRLFRLKKLNFNIVDSYVYCCYYSGIETKNDLLLQEEDRVQIVQKCCSEAGHRKECEAL